LTAFGTQLRSSGAFAIIYRASDLAGENIPDQLAELQWVAGARKSSDRHSDVSIDGGGVG